MKYFLILLLVVAPFLSPRALAQNISVESFTALPNDLDARVNSSVKDQNGEKCALIKVVTDQEGFVWEGGMLGVRKVTRKTGEYWVYVPHGAKKITIKHDQLGVLRDYHYEKPIKKARVYEMVLTTGKVRRVVEPQKVEHVYLLINSNPKGAAFYLDGTYMGKTPLQSKVKRGHYNYRFSRTMYQPMAGKVDLTEVEDEKEINADLSPDFGSLHVTTEPEKGGRLILDGNRLGQKTPATLDTLASGSHWIKAEKNWFEPVRRQVQVKPGQRDTVNLQLNPAYGHISVESKPRANLFIDNDPKGSGKFQTRLMPGVYTIRAEKQKHHADARTVEINRGDRRSITLHPQPKVGFLEVITTPWHARITLNGREYGQTPEMISDLLVGQYHLVVDKKGYGSIQKDIRIQESDTLRLKKQLPEARMVKIKTTPRGARVHIDGQGKGLTPLKTELSFGSHKLTFYKNGYEVYNRKVEITPETSQVAADMMPTTTSVSIRSKPSKAKVYIDGTYKGTTPVNLDLPLEKHDFELEKNDYKANRSYAITKNSRKEFFIRMKPKKHFFFLYTAGAALLTTTGGQSLPDFVAPFGVQTGMLGTPGFYFAARLNKKYDFTAEYKVEENSIPDYDHPERYYQFDGKELFPRLSLTGGFTFRFSSMVHWYVGGGYGHRRLLWHLKEYADVNDQRLGDAYAMNQEYSARGVELETGFVFRGQWLAWNLGCSLLEFKHPHITIGLGFNL